MGIVYLIGDVLENMDVGVIIAALIAVLGWSVTHRHNIEAQNRLFLNQVTDRARLDVTDAIREYQDWLKDLLSMTFITELTLSDHHQLPPPERVDQFVIDTMNNKKKEKWLVRLEDYEILFDKMVNCRIQLDKRHAALYKLLADFVAMLEATPTPAEKNVKALTQSIDQKVLEQKCPNG